MPVEREQIGDCTLIRANCLDVREMLQADVLLSDPPYGQNYRQGGQRVRYGKWGKRHVNVAIPGDDIPFDPSPWLAYPQVILWGAPNFASRLPDSRAWLIWDKRVDLGSNDFGDVEQAWTNLPGVARIFRHRWSGVIRDSQNGERVNHPTEKPVALCVWCLKKTTGVVCDPYMGSGSTLVACTQLSRAAIGVEIEREYFDLACQRITDAYKQPPLFPVTPVPAPTQLALMQEVR